MFQLDAFQPDAFQFAFYEVATARLGVHETIFAAVSSLVGLRYYPNTFPQERRTPHWPAIRGTIISGTPFADQCGEDLGDTDDTTVQLDVVSPDYDEMAALAGIGGTVRAALLDTDPPCTRLSYFETFDSDTKTHRGVLEYVFQPSSEPG